MKQKMSNQIFRRIWIPILAVLVTIAIVGTIAANMFSAVLDSYLGRGELHLEYAEGTDNWDSEYYTKSTSSLAEAKAASDLVSEEVCDEGIVLLKNNGILPLTESSTVTPFGYAYLNPAYSGTGAAATTDTAMVTVEQGLSAHFVVNDAAIKVMQGAEASAPDAASGTRALDSDNNSLQATMDAGESAKIYEYDPNIYQGIESDVNGTVGLVFIKRTGSEGIDKRTEAYEDGTPHYLALSQKEKDTIRYAKENCDGCVIILNTANPMELAPVMAGELEADAILWVGTAGSRGFASMGKILCGEVNPSGRLTDTYASDFTNDPTYVNFGEYHYTNSQVTDTSILDFIPGANKGTFDRTFVEYEEGIYVGYRYYETAAVEDPDFVYGELDGWGAISIPGAVCYPFGYGLSYTSFEQKITDLTNENGQITVTVQVTNTGNTAGKDVIQLYYTSPYTDYDRQNRVEKSVTNLVALDKTSMLEPNASEDVVLTFTAEDMASYDYHHVNEDGTTGCYLLEAGEYAIELKANSHDVIDSRSVTIDSTILYQGSEVRQSEKNAQSVTDENGVSLGYTNNGSDYVAASNHFDTLNAYMDDDSVTQLSRSDWTGTFPTEPVDREAPQVALDEFEWFDCFDVETDTVLGNTESSRIYTNEEPTSGASNGLSLIDMRGLDYNDEMWDKLLDQIDWAKDKENIQVLLYNAAYQTGAVASLDKPATTDKDGAMGWSVDGASSWASANVMASTWNVDLMYQIGSCIGEEGLQADLNGWYAPAVNIHRSPFSGRVYEYYSEDGLLSGKMASGAISGAADKGVFSYLKHFALNDQETYRSIFLATWANEQAVREIYLKPFEICIKEATATLKYISDDQGTVSIKTVRAATALMSAQNSIGGIIGFAHYGLLTDVLRSEWGFAGAVVTDLYPSNYTELRDMTLRAGGDMYMNQADYFAVDYDSATAKTAMRTALHNICYMTVNSNVMNGMVPGLTYYYDISPWMMLLITADIVIGAFVVFMAIRIVQRSQDAKKHPEKYRQPKAQKAKIEMSP